MKLSNRTAGADCGSRQPEAGRPRRAGRVQARGATASSGSSTAATALPRRQDRARLPHGRWPARHAPSRRVARRRLEGDLKTVAELETMNRRELHEYTRTTSGWKTAVGEWDLFSVLLSICDSLAGPLAYHLKISSPRAHAAARTLSLLARPRLHAQACHAPRDLAADPRLWCPGWCPGRMPRRARERTLQAPRSHRAPRRGWCSDRVP